MDDKRCIYQYFCRRCGYERDGLLDHPARGFGSYAWACPRCKSHDIDSREVKADCAERKEP